MTPNLVELDQTKTALRIDTDASDGDLALMITAASRAVINYLKRDLIEVTDTSGGSPDVTEVVMDLTVSPPIVPEEVQWATIALVGYWYRDPDADPAGAFERGYLPPAVTALLYPLRDPAIG